MRDKHQLGALGESLERLAVAMNVGVVERRVDLVQETERRRVELENGEDERHRRQGLLAAREQVDGAVAFAGRTRHHGHAGLKQVVVGQFQIGATAAEQFRKKFLEIDVDLVKGVLEQGARFTIHLADRLCQRGQCLGEIGVLLVQVLLAAGLFFVLLDRHQVDRPESLDALKRLLQSGGPLFFRGGGGQARQQIGQRKAAFSHLLDLRVATRQQFLAGHAFRLHGAADFLGLALLGMALLIEIADGLLGVGHGRARRRQPALNLQPLLQAAVELPAQLFFRG